MLIRPLDIHSDLDMVANFYRAAPEYWQRVDGHPPERAKAKRFFLDVPPNCNGDDTQRLGLFIDERLSGLADVSFGYPDVGDAYLGLMILGPWAQNSRTGALFLRYIEDIARAADAGRLYLAVMTINARGRAFWEREGFSATGLNGFSVVGEARQELHRLVKAL